MNHTDKTDPDFNQPTYYGTIQNNPAWQAWGLVAEGFGYDWHESVETGWLSEGHLEAFLNWYKNDYEA